MLIKTIKQNFAGFAAVAIAFTGLTAMAPAHAAGTSVTTAEVTYTSVNRQNVTTNANVLTLTGTVGADERLQNIWINADFADFANQFALQAGDQIKYTAVYSNLTDSSTLTYFSNSSTNFDGFNQTTSANFYGNSSGVVSGTGNTLTRTVALTNFVAGNYSTLGIDINLNQSDPSISAGDNLSVAVTFLLVRGGVESPLNLVGANYNGTSIYFAKVGTVNHTIGATDTNVNINSNFCIYRGENGVTNSTQIEIGYTNSGTSGAFSNVWVEGSVYGGGGYFSGTGVGLTKTLTLPASGWDVIQVRSNAYTSGSLTAGQTVIPVLSAVIAGTSTSVIDTCTRKITVGTAPTVTPGASSMAISWTIPTLPVAGSWDNIRVMSCETTLNTCGDYTRTYLYNPSQVYVQTMSHRSNGMLSNTATSFTATSMTMMPMGGGPNQPMPSQWSTSGNYKYYVVFEDYDSPYYAVTAVSAAATTTGGGNQVVQNNNVVAPINSIPTNIPLVRPNLALSQTVRAGGALVIEADNAASVSEVKIGGVDAKLEVVGKGVEVVVPTGLTPGAKDLFIKTDTGSTLHIGAIKIADPVLEAQKLAVAKAAASVSFRAPIDLTVSGSRPSAKQVTEARQLAAEYKTAKEAICVAVPASRATVSSARAAASAVCAAMKAVNRKLKVTIVVEAPSGARANVISSELIG